MDVFAILPEDFSHFEWLYGNPNGMAFVKVLGMTCGHDIVWYKDCSNIINLNKMEWQSLIPMLSKSWVSNMIS